jgi:hypothetical protein
MFHRCAVRLGPDQLKMMALAALEEAAIATGDAPVAPGRALRLALAYLYAQGEGDRWPFDHFWRAVTRGHGEEEQEGAAAIGRSQAANACLNAIYRAVGVERTAAIIYRAAKAAR